MSLSFDLKAMRKLHVTRLHHWTLSSLLMHREHMHNIYEAHNLRKPSIVKKHNDVNSCTLKPYPGVRWVNHTEVKATEPASFIANPASITTSSRLASPPVIVKSYNTNKIAGKVHNEEEVKFLPSADEVHAVVVRSLEVHPDSIARAVQLLVGARSLSLTPHIESFDVIVKALCNFYNHKEVGEKLVNFVESMMSTVTSAGKATVHNYDVTSTNKLKQRSFWESSFAMLERIITHHLLLYPQSKEEEEIESSSLNASMEFVKIERTALSFTEWQQLLSLLETIEAHHMQQFTFEWYDKDSTINNAHFFSIWEKVFDALWEFVKCCDTMEQSTENKKINTINNEYMCVNEARSISSSSSSFAECTAVNIITRATNVLCNLLKSFCTNRNMHYCGREVISDNVKSNTSSENSIITKENTENKESCQAEDLQRKLTSVLTFLERKLVLLQEQISLTYSKTENTHSLNANLETYVQRFWSNTLALMCELISTAVEYIYKVEETLHNVHLLAVVQVFHSSFTLLQQLEQIAKQVSTLADENGCDEMNCKTNQYIAIDVQNDNNKINHHYYQYYYYEEEFRNAWLFITSKWQEILLTLEIKSNELKHVTNDKNGSDITAVCDSNVIVKVNEKTNTALVNKTDNANDKNNAVDTLCNKTWLHVTEVSDVLINRLTIHYSEYVKAMELWESVRHLHYNYAFLEGSVKLSRVNINKNNEINDDTNNYEKTVEESFHKTQMRLLRQLHDLQKESPSPLTNVSRSTTQPANCVYRMTSGKQWEQQLITRITTSIARRDLMEGCHCIEEWIAAVKEYQQSRYSRPYHSLEKMHGSYEEIQTTFPQNEMETNTVNRFTECNHDLLCHYILLMLERIIVELPWLTGWLYYCKVICSLSCLCNMKSVNDPAHINDNIGNNVLNIKYKQSNTSEQLQLQEESFVEFSKEANGTFAGRSKETFLVIDDNVEHELNNALVAIFTKMRLESNTSLIDALHVLECTVKFADGNWHVHSAVYDELLHMLYNLTQYNCNANGINVYNTTVCKTNRHSIATQFTRAHEEVCLSMVQNITEMLHEQSIKNKIATIEQEYAKFESKSNEEDATIVSEMPSTQANVKKQYNWCTPTHFSRLSVNNNKSTNNVMNEPCLSTSKNTGHSASELYKFSELPTLTNSEVNFLATLAPLIAIATPAQLELYKSQYFSYTRTLQAKPNNSSIHSVSSSTSMYHEENNNLMESALQKSVCRIRAVDLQPLLIKYREPILWRIHSQTMPTPDEYKHEQSCSSSGTNLTKPLAAAAAATWNSSSDYTLINCIAQNEKVQLHLSTLLHESHITSVDDIFDDAHAETVRRVAHALQTTLFYGLMTEETAMEIVKRAATAALNLQQIRWPVLLEAELAYYTLHHKGRTPIQLELNSIASSPPRITQNHYHHQGKSFMTSKDIACYYTVFHNILLPSLQLTLTQLRMLARYVEWIYDLKQIHDERLCTLHKSNCDASTRRDTELQETNNYERTMFELCSYIYFDQYHRKDLNLHAKSIASPLIIYVVYNKTYKSLRKLNLQQKAEQEELILEKQGKERKQSVNKDYTLQKKLSECFNRYKTNNYTHNNTLSQLTKKIVLLYVKARRLEDSRGATCTQSTLAERESIVATTATKLKNMKKSFIDIICTVSTNAHDQEQYKLFCEKEEEEENHLPHKYEEWNVAKYTKTLINVMLSSKSVNNNHGRNLYNNTISKQNVFYSLEMRWLMDNILEYIEKGHMVPDSISLMMCEECKRVMSKCANSTIGRETFPSNDKNNNSISNNISISSDCHVSSSSKIMISELVKNEMLYSCKESETNACQPIIMQHTKYAHAVRVHDITQLLATLCEINAFRYFNPVHLRTLQTLLAVQPAQLKRIPHRKKNIK